MLHPDADLFAQIPNVFQRKEDVLTRYWLPLLVGRENMAGYDDIQPSILMDMFGQDVWDFGPHHAELRDFLLAFLDLVRENVVDPAQPEETERVWLRELTESMRQAYNFTAMDLNATALHMEEIQLAKLGISHTTWFPNRINHLTRGPKFIYPGGSWEALHAQHAFRVVQPMHNIPLGLICLQYAYLNPVAAGTAGFQGRNLIRSHNAFCRGWGLPELAWATDANVGER